MLAVNRHCVAKRQAMYDVSQLVEHVNRRVHVNGVLKDWWLTA